MRISPAERHEFRWLEKRAGCGLSSKSSAVKVCDSEGCIHGMVGYDNWTDTCVTVHMAVDTPIAWRRLLPVVYWYPFVQMQRRMAIGMAGADNLRALEMQRRLGFKEIYRLKDGWSEGVDLVCVRLDRDEPSIQRWLHGRQG